MNCQQFEKSINEMLDDRIDPLVDSAIVAHTTECDTCRSELSLYRAIHINMVPGDEVTSSPTAGRREIQLHSAGDREQKRSGLVARRNDSNRNKFVAYVALATTAAAILLMLTPFGVFLFSPSPSPNVALNSEPAMVLGSNSFRMIQSSESTNSSLPGKARLVGQTKKQVPEKSSFVRINGLAELEKVGQSIHSVWDTIREDQYLLPFIQQGALIWVPGA